MERIMIDADQGIAAPAVVGEPASARGDVVHGAIEHRNLDRRLLDEPEDLRLPVAQRLLGRLDVGDVAADADHPHRPAFLEMDLAPRGDPTERPVVLPMNAVLGLVGAVAGGIAGGG